jgi:tetratricopeptide (TPR) repeat protein
MKYACRIATLLLIFGTMTVHAQGFGLLSKKVVSINRLLPPTVNLKGKKIRVEATADATQKGSDILLALLKTKLVTLIQKDPRFILNDTSPETILKFSITNFYTEKYVSGTGTNQSVTNRGKIEVAYQAIDVATNVALDSENLIQVAGHDPLKTGFMGIPLPTSNKKQAAAEGSENETRDQLVSGIVDSMAKRIAPLDQPFDAPLPVKKLEPLSSLALSGRWGAVEEGAEKMEKFPKPDEDAYRLYLIALAKEAQAYNLTREANERDLGKRTDISTADADAEFHRAQKYLDEAGALYKQAITANPKEKEFRPGDTRTEEALEIYAKIERYKTENAKVIAAKAADAAAQAKARANGDKVAPKVSDNTPTPLDQVLDFCHRGMAVESIKEYIDSPDFLADARATHYTFSFAKDSVKLNDTCKASAPILQKEIRLRLGSAPRR